MEEIKEEVVEIEQAESDDESLAENSSVAPQTPPVELKPNVMWRGEDEPLSFVLVGMTRIKLPDAQVQKVGFYHAEADLLTRVVKGYKLIKPKG